MEKRKKRAADTHADATQGNSEGIPLGRQTVVRLTFQQRTKVAEALHTRREVLLADRPHPADVAAELSKALGFVVTPQHVRTGMGDSGVSWKSRRRQGTWPLSRMDRLLGEVLDAARRLADRGRDAVPEDDLVVLEKAAMAFSEVARQRCLEGGEDPVGLAVGE